MPHSGCLTSDKDSGDKGGTENGSTAPENESRLPQLGVRLLCLSSGFFIYVPSRRGSAGGICHAPFSGCARKSEEERGRAAPSSIALNFEPRREL
ncbi:unnamed protein product [Lota lota]